VLIVVCGALVLGLGWSLWGRLFHEDLVPLPVTGATLVWHPGMNSGRAPTSRRPSARANSAQSKTTLSAVDALQLAKLINTSDPRPKGPVDCPADFGSTTDASFYEDSRPTTHVSISLTGCAGPPERVMSDDLALVCSGSHPRDSGHGSSNENHLVDQPKVLLREFGRHRTKRTLLPRSDRTYR